MVLDRVVLARAPVQPVSPPLRRAAWADSEPAAVARVRAARLRAQAAQALDRVAQLRESAAQRRGQAARQLRAPGVQPVVAGLLAQPEPAATARRTSPNPRALAPISNRAA